MTNREYLRNILNQLAGEVAADNAIDLCNLLSAHVEEHNPSDDAL
jgi:hypothetical protein